MEISLQNCVIFYRNRDSAHLHVRLEKMKKYKETVSQKQYAKNVLKKNCKKDNIMTDHHTKLKKSWLHRMLQKTENDQEKKAPQSIEKIPKL